MDGFTPSLVASEDSSAAMLFLFQQDRLLVRGDGSLPMGRPEQYGVLAPQFLGTLAGRSAFAAAVSGDAPPSLTWRRLRSAYGTLPDAQFALAGYAYQVVEWDRTHRFCGACATPTEAHPTERAKRCPECGLTSYPRLAPAVIVLVRRERELLLARSPHFPPGMYSAVAGFVELGETLEECVQREVREEVGLEISTLRYFGSQPWPFPHSLMIGFTAEYAGGDVRVDGVEIEDAAWFSPDALPTVPPDISIARALIDASLGSS